MIVIEKIGKYLALICSLTWMPISLAQQVPPSPGPIDEAFSLVQVEKTKVYRGEGVTVKYYLFTENELTQDTVLRFPQLKFFLKRFYNIYLPPEKIYLNSKFYYRHLKYIARIFPEKTGKLEIDPIRFLVSPSSSPLGKSKKKEIMSPPLFIEVMDLPPLDKDKKKIFSGLVGEHQIHLEQKGKGPLIKGRPFVLKLKVKGDGALEKFLPPPIIKNSLLQEFEVKWDFQFDFNDKASKVFELTFVPKKIGKLETQTFSLYSFHPLKKSYIKHTFKVGARTIIEGKNSDANSLLIPNSALGFKEGNYAKGEKEKENEKSSSFFSQYFSSFKLFQSPQLTKLTSLLSTLTEEFKRWLHQELTHLKKNLGPRLGLWPNKENYSSEIYPPFFQFQEQEKSKITLAQINFWLFLFLCGLWIRILWKEGRKRLKERDQVFNFESLEIFGERQYSQVLPLHLQKVILKKFHQLSKRIRKEGKNTSLPSSFYSSLHKMILLLDHCDPLRDSGPNGRTSSLGDLIRKSDLSEEAKEYFLKLLAMSENLCFYPWRTSSFLGDRSLNFEKRYFREFKNVLIRGTKGKSKQHQL